MISRTRINRMVAVGLLLIATDLILSELHIFRGPAWWMEYCVIAAACILIFIAAFFRLRQRAETRQSVKSSRDSLLKHLWELRHRREW